MTAAETPQAIAEEDKLRADLYDFLGALLARPPSKARLKQCAGLTGDDSELGRAIRALSRVAQATTEKSAESEFNALFIGLGRGELLPYASYYLTGFLNEKPLAMLRNDLAANHIERAPNVFEPEDNLASLCEVMAGLITGRFGAPATLERQREFFNRHIAPWATHCFTDLEAARNSVFYAPVGAIGRAFMEIEREAFRMTAS
ncbi:molecular chaperone TorD [Maritimibacter sp. 55A14]|uniref:TorD/DmsD family molecular chaperone n=1 Tax=Maritimibacter sp. 55A14 TaxID=2174844 RepID=UPI000D60D7C0|nr:molecular chaperone TorD family protein [Maritimibacter sp. 55A14]PWE32683.1 molecular chaperone TorD [Maritimibacter sp. 55A14]